MKKIVKGCEYTQDQTSWTASHIKKKSAHTHKKRPGRPMESSPKTRTVKPNYMKKLPMMIKSPVAFHNSSQSSKFRHHAGKFRSLPKRNRNHSRHVLNNGECLAKGLHSNSQSSNFHR